MEQHKRLWMPELRSYFDTIEFVNDEINDILDILDAFPSITDWDKKNILHHLGSDFWTKARKDGTPYVNHLKHTLLGVIEQYNNKPTRWAMLAAILHDSMEDTRLKYAKIKQFFGDKIWLCVEFLSKEPIWNFIWTDDTLPESEILQQHQNLAKLFQHLEWKWITHEYQIIDGELDPEYLEFIKQLKWLYKKSQQDTYFSKFDSRESIASWLTRLAEKRNITLEEGELDELVDTIIAVKISDRTHNLATLTENHQKKLQETLSYLKEIIAEIIDTPLWEKISTEISWLQYEYNNW